MQVLVNVCIPPPHVTLHLDADQSVKPPSIAGLKEIFSFTMFRLNECQPVYNDSLCVPLWWFYLKIHSLKRYLNIEKKIIAHLCLSLSMVPFNFMMNFNKGKHKLGYFNNF